MRCKCGCQCRPVGMLGSGADLDDGLDVGEARLARIAALGHDPIDGFGSGVGAGLDAAMALLDGGFGGELGGRSGGEIVLHIGFEGGLVALEGQEIVGLVGDDPVGDLDLTAHRIDGHERPGELLGLGKVVQKIGNGGDLVGLFRDGELARVNLAVVA